MRTTTSEAVFFAALMSTAIALGGALAHALEMPNKIGLSRDDYFTVQQIYSGWNRLAFLLLIQFASIVSVIYAYRHEPRTRNLAWLALLGLVGAQVLFWVFTYPANAATANWTARPENWHALRLDWEYSHLGGAVFQLFTMAALILALMVRGSAPKRSTKAVVGDRPAMEKPHHSTIRSRF